MYLNHYKIWHVQGYSLLEAVQGPLKIRLTYFAHILEQWSLSVLQQQYCFLNKDRLAVMYSFFYHITYITFRRLE